MVKIQYTKKVMDLKFQALQDNKTWVLTYFPPSYKPLSCKRIFKSKYNVDRKFCDKI